jgi:hypothetical protein
MLPKLGDKNRIMVDVDALRRGKPRTSIEFGRKAIARREGEEGDDDNLDSLAAIIALARRKTRR